jgi:hypothetical protein
VSESEWFECGGYKEDGTIYVDKNINGGAVGPIIGSIDGIYSEADRVNSAGIIANRVKFQNRIYECDKIVEFVNCDGNDATIKHVIPTPTVLTSNYVAGSTTINVANASNYRCGQFIIITDKSKPFGGFGYTENFVGSSNINPFIIGISGNVITLSVAGTVNITAANSSVGIPSTFGKVANDSTIENLNFTSNNTNVISHDWRFIEYLTSEISPPLSAGDNKITFKECDFYDIIGTCYSGPSVVFLNCSANNIGGGIYHYGADINNDYHFAHVDGMQIDNINYLSPLETVHQEAMFTFSSFSRNLFISNVKAKNVKGSILGYITLEDDFGLEMNDCVFEGVVPTWVTEDKPQLIFTMNLGVGNTPTDYELQKVFKITNCTFNTCGDISIGGMNIKKGQTNGRMVLRNNEFNNTRIIGYNAGNIDISNNKFTSNPFANHTGYTYRSKVLGFYSTATITLYSTSHVNISDNEIEGNINYNQFNDYGIITQSEQSFRKTSTGLNSKVWYGSDIKVNRNTISKYSFGIGFLPRYDDATSGWNVNQSIWGDGVFKGCEIVGNNIQFHKNTQYTPTYHPIWAIHALQGVIVEGNTIIEPEILPANALRSIIVWGINDAQKSFLLGSSVKNNLIIGSNDALNNIIVGAGSASYDMENNVIVVDNITTGNIYLALSYGDQNRKTNVVFTHLTAPYTIPDLMGLLQFRSIY